MRPASILEIGISDKISSPKINNYWQPITKIDKSIDLHDASSQLRKCLDNVLLGLSKYEGSKNIYELSGGIDSACTYCYAKSNYHEMNSNSVAITMSGGTSTWSHEEKKVNSMINQYPSKHILFDADDYHNYLELSSHSGFVSSNQPSIFNLPYAATNILSLSEKEGGDFVIGGEGADWYLDGSHYIGDYLLSNLKFKSIFNLLKKARGGNFIQVFKYISRTFVAPLLPKPIEEKAYLKQFHETLLAFEMPNIFTRTVEMSLKKGMTETLFDITLRNSNLKYWAQKNEHDLMFPPNQNWHSIGNPGGVTRIFPFFDRQMIDFGLSVPPDVKYSLKADRISYYGSCKTMQREAFKSEIPTSVITDQYKSSYSNPVTNRVVDAYSTIFEKDLFVSRLGIVNRDKFHSYVIAFHEKVKGQEPYYDDEAWIDGLYSLELWLRHIKPFLG
jgi:asparagine synthetase B (glutamine-hydrolysing)